MNPFWLGFAAGIFSLIALIAAILGLALWAEKPSAKLRAHVDRHY